MKISPKAENDLDSDSDFIIPAEGTGNQVVCIILAARIFVWQILDTLLGKKVNANQSHCW